MPCLANLKTDSARLLTLTLLLTALMWSVPSGYALGCATPSFAGATTYSIPSNVYGVAVGDFNRDGKIDAATVNKNVGTASIVLGNGAGGFGSPTNYTVGTGPTSIAAADFDLDGKLDLVTANDNGGTFQLNSFSILRGDGTGHFTVTNFPLNTLARTWLVVAADMTGDGFPDVIIRGVDSGMDVGKLFVYKGNGGGNFTYLYSTNSPVSNNSLALSVGDFNEDGRLDIVTAFNLGVKILFNNGNISFTPGPDIITGAGAVYSVTGDFNNDGKLDIATANTGVNNVAILLGDGTGGFGSPTGFPIAGNGPSAMTVGDFNSDGKSDLAVATSLPGFNNGTVSVLLGDGAGSFAGAQNTDFVRAPTSVTNADLNNDGKLDLLTGDLGPGFGGGTVTVMLNTCSESPMRRNLIGDFDGDGRTDIAVYRTPGQWYELRSSNNAFHTSPGFGMIGDRLVPGDFDGDHKTDIAVFRDSTGEWFTIDSSTGLYQIRRWGALGDIPVIGDYDGDGKSDLAVFRPTNGSWYIRQSADLSVRVQQWGAPGDVPVIGDYDGDGKSDIAVFRPGAGAWYIRHSADGTYRSQGWGLLTDKAVPGDYDGDGKTDIAVYRPESGAWYVLRSSDNSILGQAWGSITDVPVPGDYDGDGKTDLAIYRLGIWYILNSSDATMRVNFFGLPIDTPIPAAYTAN